MGFASDRLELVGFILTRMPGKAYQTRAEFVAGSVLLLMLVVAGSVAVTQVDSIAVLPGRPPPLPTQGALAQPRSPKQAGFPADLTASVIPPESLLIPGVVALGEKLFFDPRLSVDGTVACTTCHDPARAFTDGSPQSVGIYGRVGQRNAPTILNALYNKSQFWDGRVITLEQHAALPITNPFEMGSSSVKEAASRIDAIRNTVHYSGGILGEP